MHSKTFSEAFLGGILIDQLPRKYRRNDFFLVVYILFTCKFNPTIFIGICPIDRRGIADGWIFTTLTRFSIAEADGKSRNELILHSSSFAFYPEYEIDAC